MGAQGDQAAPKAPKLKPKDAQSLPKVVKRHPKIQKVTKSAKSGPKVAKTGPKMSQKLSKIVNKTYEEFGTILERIFSQNIFNVEWILQAQTFEIHCKNCGFGRFFDFCNLLFKLRFLSIFERF